MTIESERGGTVEADLESYLQRVTRLFQQSTPAHGALFAALLAERWGRVLRAGDPPLDEVLDRLWAAAAAGRLGEDVEAKCGALVRDATALVDPDDSDAFATYRQLDVLAQALRCACGADVDGALALTAAFLGAAADVSRTDARAPELLRTRWSWARVQEDARWLGVVIDALGAAAQVDGALVSAMRAAIEPREPALQAATSAAAATKPKPSAPLPVAVAVAAPTADTMPKAAPAPRRNVVSLRIGERTATFVEISADRYRVEVDGEARKLRMRVRHEYVHEGGSASTPKSVSPPWIESDDANVAPLLECLEHDATRKDGDGCVVLRAQFQWGHFRQNRWIEACVGIADDGAVTLDFDVATQDDSFY